MAKNENPSHKNPGFPRNAADPYTIHLTGEPFMFSEEMLKENTDLRVQRKRDWYYPSLKFISLEKSVLKLAISKQGQSYELTIAIEPDELHVSCKCGMEVETICHHAYKALERCVFFGRTDFFKDYQPGGIMEIATAHKKYFAIESSDLSLDIKPKAELGTVYQLPFKDKLPDISQLLHLPASTQPPLQRMKGMALSYIVVDNYRHELLPFLMPCIGYLNKAETELKGFQHFISGTKKEYDSYLTEEQKVLNKICYDMWLLAEKMPGSLIKEPVIDQEKINTLFILWQTALPLLKDESFVYTYFMYRKKELKGKPEKQKLDRVEISGETPQLHFQLIEKGEIFQLIMEGSLIQRIDNSGFKTDLLFFLKQKNTLFLLSSLRDAGLVEMMDNCNNCITVFKEHFKAFEKEILNPLRELYKVDMIISKRIMKR